MVQMDVVVVVVVPYSARLSLFLRTRRMVDHNGSRSQSSEKFLRGYGNSDHDCGCDADHWQMVH